MWRLPHLQFEQSGIPCFNADRHGFSLSQAKQEVF
jgi:hypothetical protein